MKKFSKELQRILFNRTPKYHDFGGKNRKKIKIWISGTRFWVSKLLKLNELKK
jgi:hypothetical protein